VVLFETTIYTDLASYLNKKGSSPDREFPYLLFPAGQWLNQAHWRERSLGCGRYP